jgi:hypothetical protein
MKSHYKAGTWNCICDVCGLQYKSDELIKRWDGLMVCKQDYETRHPQDLIRIPSEKNDVQWVRPDNEAFVAFDYARTINEIVTIEESFAIAEPFSEESTVSENVFLSFSTNVNETETVTETLVPLLSTSSVLNGDSFNDTVL